MAILVENKNPASARNGANNNDDDNYDRVNGNDFS